jgi:hypothetical protein
VKLIRKIHFYLGTFFAPSIIFFALTGAFQIFGLHEGSGQIAWVARLAQVHKSQTFDAPRARPPAPKPQAAAAVAQPEPAHVDAPAPPKSGGPTRSMALELFFLLMAISLIASSCLGVWMAFQYKRDARIILGLLVAGVVLPILFLAV